MQFAITPHYPQYSPDTTVQISLRQFEKDAKSQAEREYDAEKGPLASEEDAVDIRERKIRKKNRKVRSAIVSRRKSSIYERKLEEELRMRDNVNADLKGRLSVYNDVLHDIRAKISAMESTLESSRPTPRRPRVPDVTYDNQPQNFPQTVQRSDAQFFLGNDAIDDILITSSHHTLPDTALPENCIPSPDTTSPHDNVQLTKQPVLYRDDFSSECSDRQISPNLPHHYAPLPHQNIASNDDSSWNCFLPQKTQAAQNPLLSALYM